MAYVLNAINLTTDYGFYPGKQPGSSIALAGFLDMPARLGKCWHDWGKIHGVQPYTAASEIRLGGRNISLVGCILGADKYDCMLRAESLNNFIDSFTGAVNLVSPWGTQSVFVNGAVTGDYFDETGLGITLNFREPTPNLTGILPIGSGEIGIDGISWADLGGYLAEFGGDRRNRPAPKGFNLTQYQTERYITTKRSASVLNLKLFIEQPSFTAFKTKIQSLYALFSSPGERNLIVKDDFYRRVFACEGFKVTEISNFNGTFVGFVEIELMQAGLAQPVVYYLADNLGNFITDSNNNKIIVN